jgi:DNA-entry nuclease
MKKSIRALLPLFLAIGLLLSACSAGNTYSLDSIPDYSVSPYVTVNDNQPYFSDTDLTTTSFETYSELDGLGRCGVAYVSVSTDTMPTKERGSIGQIKPTGWHTVKYDCVDGKYLYNRCHLIGYQLTAENANKKNLITGTRYLNVDGMLPFENMVADYIKETDNHVLYRVTPIFDGDNLVASGVLMEAESVEDKGEGICFCVFCYNVQPDVAIDYATGESELAESYTPAAESN